MGAKKHEKKDFYWKLHPRSFFDILRMLHF